jgi:hypothetical protein
MLYTQNRRLLAAELDATYTTTSATAPAVLYTATNGTATAVNDSSTSPTTTATAASTATPTDPDLTPLWRAWDWIARVESLSGISVGSGDSSRNSSGNASEVTRQAGDDVTADVVTADNRYIHNNIFILVLLLLLLVRALLLHTEVHAAAVSAVSIAVSMML